MNGDGNVTTVDVPLFIQALVDRPTYDANNFPVVADINGDVNEDGTFDMGDIADFSDLFGGSASSNSASSSAVPEPSTLSLALVLLMGVTIRQRRCV